MNIKFHELIFGGTLCLIMLFVYLGESNDAIHKLDERVTRDERTLVMLHTCFPNGRYWAGAAPECPAFEKFVTDQANKNEPAFKEGE